MADEEQSGWPIYLDPYKRELIDTTQATHTPHEWHPMNGPANCLLKCREAFQDIAEVLENYKRTDAPKKRRRRLRAIFVPLHSLSVSIINLINSIQSDKQIHDRLPNKATEVLMLC
jgi:hypothetical protein